MYMARVNEVSHSFTCYQHVHPQMEWAILNNWLNKEESK